MKKILLSLVTVFLSIGCTSIPEQQRDTVPGYTALRPVLMLYGTYPNTESGRAQLEDGYLVDLEIYFEFTEHWAIGLGSGHYRADTTPIFFDPIFIPRPPLEGVPVFGKIQYRGLARSGLLGYYATLGGGHIFYGTDEVDDEAIAMAGLGLEIYGYQHLDIRLETDYLGALDSHMNQWLLGVGLSYSF